MRKVPIVVLAAACLAASGTVATAAPAPRVSIASINRLPTPLPFPFKPGDATAQLAAAKARAAASGKLLLIDLGGDWCADCRILAGVMALPEVSAFLDAHYVVASVDVGRLNRNMATPRHYGVRLRATGVPALLVIDPATDRLLNPDQVFALSDMSRKTPQQAADWLATWTR